MSKYRDQLPQMTDKLFITDGGLETTLIFDKGYDLPQAAAFDVFKHTNGYEVLKAYFLPYIDLARSHGAGFILESPTWRASRDWGSKIGYSPADLKAMNKKSISLLDDLRREWESPATPMVISGCIGPRGDGYRVTGKMTVDQAKTYHQEQIDTISNTEADLVSAYTINYIEEAIGIVLAAQSTGIPVVISFTVETDGRLPSGHTLSEAIERVDQATDGGPVYYIINCAHPTHFYEALASRQPWTKRIKALRANASSKSHAELDESETLDKGDPVDFGRSYAQLKELLPHLNVFGGCCGTDTQHVSEICKSVVAG